MSGLEAALHYLELGWSVLPLHGKKPAQMPNGRPFSWSALQHNRPDPTQVRAWHSCGLLKNVGVISGAVSHNLVVVDLDGLRAVQVFRGRWPGLLATRTVITGSGNGLHLYYQCEKLPPTIRVVGQTGNIELRANGCYVAAPPSIHPDTGQRYVVAGVDEVDGDVMQVADMDAVVNWLKSMTAQKRTPKPSTRPQTDKRTNGWADRALQYECRDVRTAQPGQRNERLNIAAYNLGQLVGDGLLNRAGVEAWLLDAAHSAGLSETEALATITSGMQAGIAEPRSLQWSKRR